MFPSALAEVQVVLLLQHYSTINPKCVFVWSLSGAAVRACVELGLHPQCPETKHLDVLTVDIQRRVCWVAYVTDQQACTALYRPISLSRDALDTPCFSAPEDNSITPSGIVRGAAAPRESALHWLEFRNIISSIVDVKCQGKELLDGQAWEEWLSAMEEQPF
jgi:hypothetical protein